MDNKKKDDEERTKRLSDDELEELRASSPPQLTGPELALAVYYRDGLRVVALAEDSTVVVGRSHPADVTIRDTSLSRQHACFEVREGQVWVEDLDSTNGTWVGGTRVERQQLDVGVELSLGAVTATVQRFGALDVGALDLVSHDRFMLELGAEIERARAYGRSVALVMIRDHGPEAGHVSRWLPRIRAAFRPFDRVALYSSSVVEAILPETDAASGLKLAEALVGAGGDLRCGLSSHGERLGSSHALLEAARNSLRRTTRDRPIRLEHGGASTPDGDEEPVDPGGMIAESPAMTELLATVSRLASSVIPVLIQGETGAGKEVVARWLHDGGKRKDKPFVAVNCGAIPEQLVESTLFGHERGAFTGANAQRKGIFEAADGGTVLLDEVGELPAPAQASLLRVLETKQITRVGATREIAVDVRVLAATHRDLEAMCDEGTFRSDLLYRLDAMSLTVPPLRERPEDVAPLARHFLALAAEANECDVSGISDAAMTLLAGYAWPGNVRELRNTIERATVIASDPIIGVEDLPERMRNLESPSARAVNAAEDNQKERPSQTFEAINLRTEVKRFEARLIREALRHTGWKRKEAAKLLGVPRRTLADKVLSYDIKPE